MQEQVNTMSQILMKRLVSLRNETPLAPTYRMRRFKSRTVKDKRGINHFRSLRLKKMVWYQYHIKLSTL